MTLPPRSVIAVSLAVAATLLGDTLLYAVLPAIWESLGLELWMVGVLLSANRFVRLLTNPLAGRVVERIGAGRPFAAAVVLGALTTAAYAGGGFAVLLAARLLWGLCWSFLRLGGYIAALDAADDDHRGYYLGFFSGTARLGTLVAVLAGGVLTDTIGFRATTLVFGAATLLAGLALVRAHLPGQDAHPAASAEAPPDTTGTAPQGGRAALRALHAAAFLNGAAGSTVIVATLGLLLLQRFGAEVAVLGLVVGIASLNGVLLGVRFAIDLVWAPAAGHLSDRVGRAPVLFVTALVTAVAMAGLAADAGLGRTAALAVVAFLGGTALRAVLDSIAGDLAPVDQRARSLSVYANWSDLGAATGPFLAYQVVGIVGLSGVYGVSAGALCAVGLGAVAVHRLSPASRQRAA
ncbi:MAG: MFS transporter [Deltaproteobacteria bacterium]|nr:MFS transporter [Deltaproteobacteria bacterium]